MAETTSKLRAAVKFGFWALLSAAMILYVAQYYASGKMAASYYHTASQDGYAINTNTFGEATKEHPVTLTTGTFEKIEGPVAVPVKQGERLPANANGIITSEVLEKGNRAVLEADGIKVTVPWEIKESKGFKYKDTFKHKGIKTDPWSGAWNVAVVIGLGLVLGFMAEGFTDLLGWKLHKLRHFEGH
ncbi:MAG: hypothetical protein AB1640_13620 [bacterium]